VINNSAASSAAWRIDLTTSSPLTDLAADHIAADAPVDGLEKPREISPGARQEIESQRYADEGVRQVVTLTRLTGDGNSGRAKPEGPVPRAIGGPPATPFLPELGRVTVTRECETRNRTLKL